MAIRIRDWLDIRDEYSGHLLVGNGGSVAVWPDLGYDSLYREASKSLSKGAKRLFEALGTTNFETTLDLLQKANVVNSVLDVEEEATRLAYEDVRRSLVTTVRNIHPTFENVKSELKPIAVFMTRFHTVFSLCYDTIIYWAILVGNDEHGENVLKDCWLHDGSGRRGYFEYSYEEYLRKPHCSRLPTLVFYPHGSLSLCTDAQGNEHKVVKHENESLLETVEREWTRDGYRPLIVSEGTSSAKLRTIGQSQYLRTVYEDQLMTIADTLVVFGWRAGIQDTHVVDAIAAGPPKKLAISVFRPTDEDLAAWERFAVQFNKKVHDRHAGALYAHIEFFDAESDGFWCRCSVND